jgi:hypothetical protein
MTEDRFRAMWRTIAKPGTAAGMGAALVGLAALVSAGGWVYTAAEDRDHLNDLRFRNGILTEQLTLLTDELACRSRAATEASNLQAEIGLWTARGLAAFARGNDAGLEEAAVEIEVLTVELGPVLERRTESIAGCSDGDVDSPTPIPVPPPTVPSLPPATPGTVP